MKIYQALQQSAAGSKESIRNARDSKEKRKHILFYVIKVLLTTMFCFAVVSIFSILFGSVNSVAGVVVLLSLLVLQKTDFGIRTSHGVIVVFAIFGILIVGPRLSNTLTPIPAFLVNLICIMGIMVLGCHKVVMSNQATFVLGYLILQGYDVTGHDFKLRVLGLASGAILLAAVFYHTHVRQIQEEVFLDLFRTLDIHNASTQWYLRFTFGLAAALLIANLLHLPRAMWVGVSAMSLLQPTVETLHYRVKRRLPFNVIGCLVFFILYIVLPKNIYPYIGLIGGIGVGFSVSYGWQTIFNTFGALMVATDTFGLVASLVLRVLTNAIGSLCAFLFDKTGHLMSRLLLRFS